MIKLGGHVLRSPGRSTWSLWSWSRCQMKNTLEIFIISKDRVLSLINCPFTSRRIFQTLRMWFSGSNFGRSLPYKHSTKREVYWGSVIYEQCCVTEVIRIADCSMMWSDGLEFDTRLALAVTPWAGIFRQPPFSARQGQEGHGRGLVFYRQQNLHKWGNIEYL